jgi:hypothetical protein
MSEVLDNDELWIDPRRVPIERFGRVFWYVTEPRCHVCRSPYRRTIELTVWWSFGSWKGLTRSLPPDAGITTQGIRRHFQRRHHPMFDLFASEFDARAKHAAVGVMLQRLERATKDP